MRLENLTIKIKADTKYARFSFRLISFTLWLEHQRFPAFINYRLWRIAVWLTHHVYITYRIDNGKKRWHRLPLEITRNEP